MLQDMVNRLKIKSSCFWKWGIVGYNMPFQKVHELGGKVIACSDS